MLYLTRKRNESIMIGDDIEISVVEIRGKTVKLGINFPKTATVLRREVYDRIQAENRAAMDTGTDVGALFSSKAPKKDSDDGQG